MIGNWIHSTPSMQPFNSPKWWSHESITRLKKSRRIQLKRSVFSPCWKSKCMIERAMTTKLRRIIRKHLLRSRFYHHRWLGASSLPWFCDHIIHGVHGRHLLHVKQFKPVATSHLFVFVVETVRVGFPSSSEQQSAIRRVRHPVEACILCLLWFHILFPYYWVSIEFLLSFLTTLGVARRSRSSHSYGERQSDLFRASLHLQECVFLHYGHFISGLFLRVQQITSSRSFPASHSERLIEGLCEL